MKYYIVVNNQHQGPYTVDELKAMNIAPDTYVWCEGMPDWVRATDVEEIRQGMVGPSIPTIPSSGPSVPPPSIPNPQPAYTAAQQQPVVQPKSWLVESILVTLFCCLPFGIVGIVKAAETNSAISRGDFAAAEASSRDAGKWVKLGFWIGLAVMVVYIIFYVVVFAIAGLSGSSSSFGY
ncbi:MAG: CD225/dispanin family protein [Pseudoflavonifractor sp.]|nr:CD225/dispanin family protein [Pseudoflavonifractor sp.]